MRRARTVRANTVPQRTFPQRTFLGAAAAVAVLALAGCGDPDSPMLMHAASEERGPDEFGIVPTRPLEMPDRTDALPEPGGSNRADPQPRADVAAALGGSRTAALSSAIPAADGALVTRAARFGTNPAIRDQLAAEDLEFRRANRGRLLERMFGVNVYHRNYRVMALDRHAELERWRARGVRPPGAPPDPRD